MFEKKTFFLFLPLMKELKWKKQTVIIPARVVPHPFCHGGLTIHDCFCFTPFAGFIHFFCKVSARVMLSELMRLKFILFLSFFSSLHH